MLSMFNAISIHVLILRSLVLSSVLLLTPYAYVASASEFPPNTVHLRVALEGEEFSSIKAAFEKAHSIQRPVAIHIASGTYREGGLRVFRRDHPLWILGDPDGGTIISGSDVWDDWETRGDLLIAHWPHDWGNFKFNDPRWLDADRKTFRPAGARSEMVFVDGKKLIQVTDKDALSRGSFMVDLENQELLIHMPAGADSDSAKIEVGMRPNILTMLQPKDVTMRHITIQHMTSHIKQEGRDPFGPWGASIFGEHKESLRNTKEIAGRLFAENILIEHCRFIHNNRAGLIVANAKNVMIRHCNFDDNGLGGVMANRCRNVTIEDSTLNRNAWRLGKLGNAAASLPAATKMLFMLELTFRRCEVKDNYSAGLWFDTSVNHLIVEDCDIQGNWSQGFYYEHCQGPALLKNTTISNNGYNDGSRTIPVDVGGVLFAESEHLIIDNCTIENNNHYQVGVRSLDRPGRCYWTGRRNDGSSRYLTLTNSRITGSSYTGENVLDFYTDAHRLSTLVGRQVHAKEAMYVRDFLPTYVASGNTYFNDVSEEVFATGPKWGHVRVSLKDWQDLTGQDLDSVWRSGR